jgi:hypothetical protein
MYEHHAHIDHPMFVIFNVPIVNHINMATVRNYEVEALQMAVYMQCDQVLRNALRQLFYKQQETTTMAFACSAFTFAPITNGPLELGM